MQISDCFIDARNMTFIVLSVTSMYLFNPGEIYGESQEKSWFLFLSDLACPQRLLQSKFGDILQRVKRNRKHLSQRLMPTIQEQCIYWCKLTVFRLQLSALGSKINILSFVKETSNTKTKSAIDTTVNHCSHPVPPVPSWYDANVKRISVNRIKTWIFCRKFMVPAVYVVVYIEYLFDYETPLRMQRHSLSSKNHRGSFECFSQEQAASYF